MKVWVHSQVQISPPGDAPEGTQPHVFTNGMGVETKVDITDFQQIEPGLSNAVRATLSQQLGIPVEALTVNVLGLTVLQESRIVLAR